MLCLIPKELLISKPKNTRERRLARNLSLATVYYKPLPVKVTDPYQTFNSGYEFSGRQKTVSEGHHWPVPNNRKGLHDEGGPFYTTKSYTDYVPNSHVRLEESFEGFFRKYTGPLLCPFPRDVTGKRPLYPPTLASSDSEMDVLGTNAISICAPTNSVADASTFLSELFSKYGVPTIPGYRLWEKRAEAYLGVADEFLNVVFGWLPLVKDVTDLSDAVRHASIVLKQYERDAGKVVRRTFNYPSVREETDSDYDLNPPVAVGPGQFFKVGPGARKVVRKRVVTRKRWFSGAFTYHIPATLDSWQALIGIGSQANKLLGTTLTPSTLWELTPWSWLADWFSNSSEVIKNLESFELDGLVLRYGYMMEHTIVKDTYTLVGASGFNSVNVNMVAPVTLVTETKQRRPATPFGFGIEWTDLSTVQLAILAALGITRFG